MDKEESMTEWLQDVEDLTLKGQINVPYTWSVGEVGSRFLTALRDEQKILGNRCPGCNTVYVPPRKNCGSCFRNIDNNQWTEVGPEGVVTAFTIVRYDYPLQPAKAPFACAIIKLDGVDVGFVHLIRKGLEKLKSGVRVRPLFKKERTGHILDIDSFELLEA
jgi:uncharacterized OB-fold protein